MKLCLGLGCEALLPDINWLCEEELDDADDYSKIGSTTFGARPLTSNFEIVLMMLIANFRCTLALCCSLIRYERLLYSGK